MPFSKSTSSVTWGRLSSSRYWTVSYTHLDVYKRQIPERLSYFIEKDQMTPEEYLETRGQDYRNAPFLQAYGHEGDPCPVCAAPLSRLVIGGRSSTFCPVCQREAP